MDCELCNQRPAEYFGPTRRDYRHQCRTCWESFDRDEEMDRKYRQQNTSPREFISSHSLRSIRQPKSSPGQMYLFDIDVQKTNLIE